MGSDFLAVEDHVRCQDRALKEALELALPAQLIEEDQRRNHQDRGVGAGVGTQGVPERVLDQPRKECKHLQGLSETHVVSKQDAFAAAEREAVLEPAKTLLLMWLELYPLTKCARPWIPWYLRDGR